MYETTTADEHDDEEGPGLRAWNAGMARALWPARSSSGGGGPSSAAARGGAWGAYAPLSRSRQSSLNHRVQGVLQATTALSGHGAASGAASAGAPASPAPAAAAGAAQAAATAGGDTASASSVAGDAGAASPRTARWTNAVRQ